MERTFDNQELASRSMDEIEPLFERLFAYYSTSVNQAAVQLSSLSFQPCKRCLIVMQFLMAEKSI
jgi:hypothetical protein